MKWTISKNQRAAILSAGFIVGILLGFLGGVHYTIVTTSAFLNHALEGTNFNVVIDINETAMVDRIHENLGLDGLNMSEFLEDKK